MPDKQRQRPWDQGESYSDVLIRAAACLPQALLAPLSALPTEATAHVEHGPEAEVLQ